MCRPWFLEACLELKRRPVTAGLPHWVAGRDGVGGLGVLGGPEGGGGAGNLMCILVLSTAACILLLTLTHCVSCSPAWTVVPCKTVGLNLLLCQSQHTVLTSPSPIPLLPALNPKMMYGTWKAILKSRSDKCGGGRPTVSPSLHLWPHQAAESMTAAS